ncbi:MAG: hypothetical protein ACW98Y_18630 [Candidatus Thorarchaeota archaeon]|jgi:hypothetical protein
MDKFEVDNKGEYVSAWISYLSTAVGILRSMGEETDLVYTGGYTGYAFHINTARNDTCPSAPTVAPFELFREGLQSFGWKVTFGWSGPEFSPSEDEKEITRARDYFEDIKTTLTRTNRPVGIWGIPVPEFGIVNGFDGDNYIVSTFRGPQSRSKDEEPIRFNQLIAPGGLSKMVFEEPIDLPDHNSIDKDALQRAIHIAKGVKFDDEKTDAGYVTGPDALSQWADTIKTGVVPKSEEESKQIKGKTQLNYHGNAYVAACTKEGMDLASSFLMRLSRRYKSETFTKDLEEASHQYKHAGEKMRIFTELFPFSMELNWKEEEFNEEKRAMGSQLLSDAKPHIVAAINSMEKAFSKWS